MRMDHLLRSIYYDPVNPAAYSSADRLYRAVKKRDTSVTIKNVKDFLSGEIPYTLHRRIVRRYIRNPVVSSFKGEHCQADLIDIQKHSRMNDGFRFILTVIDVFTKFAFAIPIKDKSSKSVSVAFASLFKRYHPQNIQTDEGKEFINKEVQSIFKTNRCHWFPAKNEQIKCAVVERFQRTLMTRVQKYITAGNPKFIDKLDDFISAYNNSFHRSIKMTPIEACSASTQQVFLNLYGFDDERALLRNVKKKPILRIDDSVRIGEQKNRFKKGYAQNFTDQVYTVSHAIQGTKTPVYSLRDEKGQAIKGNFYGNELQKISNPHTYRINILDEKGRGRNKRYFVRYINFPESSNEWISASSVSNLNNG